MTSATGKPHVSGFSLVEIVVTLTIIVIIAGGLIPSVQGLVREQQAREPIRELQDQARDVRARAIRTGRPFQIGLDAKGFFASAYYQPYQVDGEYEELKRDMESRQLEKDILDASERRFGTTDPEANAQFQPDDEYLVRYEWPEGLKIEVLFWGEAEWEPLDGPQTHRWIFQPTGMCNPLTIRMNNDNVSLEARFNALSGEIESETSSVR